MRLISVSGLRELVAIYFQGPPLRNFAGHLFDSLPENRVDKVTAGDLVAMSLLDVSFGAKATFSLLEEGFLDDDLANLPSKVELWNAPQEIGKLYLAYWKLQKLSGVGPTKASKLLARKRPHLAPITDTHVQAFFGCRGWEFLEPLVTCLGKDSSLESGLDSLKPGAVGADTEVSTLRVLDVAIWMTLSGSRNAKEARCEVWGRPDTVQIMKGCGS